jgi:hypothetical protein
VRESYTATERLARAIRGSRAHIDVGLPTLSGRSGSSRHDRPGSGPPSCAWRTSTRSRRTSTAPTSPARWLTRPATSSPAGPAEPDPPSSSRSNPRSSKDATAGFTLSWALRSTAAPAPLPSPAPTSYRWGGGVAAGRAAQTQPQLPVAGRRKPAHASAAAPHMGDVLGQLADRCPDRVPLAARGAAQAAATRQQGGRVQQRCRGERERVTAQRRVRRRRPLSASSRGTPRTRRSAPVWASPSPWCCPGSRR